MREQRALISASAGQTISTTPNPTPRPRTTRLVLTHLLRRISGHKIVKSNNNKSSCPNEDSMLSHHILLRTGPYFGVESKLESQLLPKTGALWPWSEIDSEQNRGFY